MLSALRHPVSFTRDHRFTVRHASDYLDGDLGRDDLERVQRHASLCPRCHELLDGMRRTVGALSTLRAPERSSADSSIVSSVLQVLDDEQLRTGRRDEWPPGTSRSDDA